MHVGIVAEGPSDLILLEALIRVLRPDVVVTRIQPEATLGERGSGWKGVRSWCREFGDDLSSVMTADPDDIIDVLLIHVDCSMAHNVSAARACPPASDTADALQSVVVAEWLGLAARPSWLFVATPSASSDTWVTSVLAPPPTTLEVLECVPAHLIEAHLVARRLLRRKTNGQVAKSARRYETYAQDVAAKIDVLRAACTEADRFCAQIS